LWNLTLALGVAAQALLFPFISLLPLTLFFFLLPEVTSLFSSSSLFLILLYIITHCFSFTFTGAESVVYEGTLNGDKVAVKKPILSLSEHINNFHKQLQLLWFVSLFLLPIYS